MNLTADKILKLGLVDDIIPEPLGGAHRNYQAMANSIKSKLVEQLAEVQSVSIPTLLKECYKRIMAYGVNE